MPWALTRDEYGTVYVLCWDRSINSDAGTRTRIGTGKVYVVQLQEPTNQYIPQFHPKIVPKAVELPGIRSPQDFSVTYNFLKHTLDIYVGEGVIPGRVTLFSLPLH